MGQEFENFKYQIEALKANQLSTNLAYIVGMLVDKLSMDIYTIISLMGSCISQLNQIQHRPELELRVLYLLSEGNFGDAKKVLSEQGADQIRIDERMSGDYRGCYEVIKDNEFRKHDTQSYSYPDMKSSPALLIPNRPKEQESRSFKPPQASSQLSYNTEVKYAYSPTIDSSLRTQNVPTPQGPTGMTVSAPPLQPAGSSLSYNYPGSQYQSSYKGNELKAGDEDLPLYESYVIPSTGNDVGKMNESLASSNYTFSKESTDRQIYSEYKEQEKQKEDNIIGNKSKFENIFYNPVHQVAKDSVYNLKTAQNLPSSVSYNQPVQALPSSLTQDKLYPYNPTTQSQNKYNSIHQPSIPSPQTPSYNQGNLSTQPQSKPASYNQPVQSSPQIPSYNQGNPSNQPQSRPASYNQPVQSSPQTPSYNQGNPSTQPQSRPVSYNQSTQPSKHTINISNQQAQSLQNEMKSISSMDDVFKLICGLCKLSLSIHVTFSLHCGHILHQKCLMEYIGSAESLTSSCCPIPLCTKGIDRTQYPIIFQTSAQPSFQGRSLPPAKLKCPACQFEITSIPTNGFVSCPRCLQLTCLKCNVNHPSSVKCGH